MVMAPIIGKIHVNHSKCDNVIENIQVHIYPFPGLKFCTNVNNKHEKGIFDQFYFMRKKKDFQETEIMLHMTF